MNKRLMTTLAAMAASIATPAMAQEQEPTTVLMPVESFDLAKVKTAEPVALRLTDPSPMPQEDYRVPATPTQDNRRDILELPRDNMNFNRSRGGRQVNVGFGFSASLSGNGQTSEQTAGICIAGETNTPAGHIARLK